MRYWPKSRYASLVCLSFLMHACMLSPSHMYIYTYICMDIYAYVYVQSIGRVDVYLYIYGMLNMLMCRRQAKRF